MTADILSKIDAATDNRCACNCGQPLPPDGPSAYYVDADHQRRWNHTQATRPYDVYDRKDAAPCPVGPMRWRPDLVDAAPDEGLLPNPVVGRRGPYRAQFFVRADRDAVHLRLDDGHRFVGCDVELYDSADVAVADDQITAMWTRLERELANARHVDDGAASFHWAPHLARWDATWRRVLEETGARSTSALEMIRTGQPDRNVRDTVFVAARSREALAKAVADARPELRLPPRIGARPPAWDLWDWTRVVIRRLCRDCEHRDFPLPCPIRKGRARCGNCAATLPATKVGLRYDLMADRVTVTVSAGDRVTARTVTDEQLHEDPNAVRDVVDAAETRILAELGLVDSPDHPAPWVTGPVDTSAWAKDCRQLIQRELILTDVRVRLGGRDPSHMIRNVTVT